MEYQLFAITWIFKNLFRCIVNKKRQFKNTQIVQLHVTKKESWVRNFILDELVLNIINKLMQSYIPINTCWIKSLWIYYHDLFMSSSWHLSLWFCNPKLFNHILPPSTSNPNPMFYNKILPISNILEVLTSKTNSFQVPNNFYSINFVIISPTTQP
jgi:hypothetical protein